MRRRMENPYQYLRSNELYHHKGVKRSRAVSCVRLTFSWFQHHKRARAVRYLRISWLELQSGTVLKFDDEPGIVAAGLTEDASNNRVGNTEFLELVDGFHYIRVIDDLTSRLNLAPVFPTSEACIEKEPLPRATIDLDMHDDRVAVGVLPEHQSG